MDFSNLKKDKGVAGLTILLSIVTLLFVIGLLIMIFALMGGELEDATENAVAGGDTIQQFTTVLTNTSETALVNATLLALEDISCSLYNITNSTGVELVGASNYTQSGCYITLTDGSPYNGTALWNATLSFAYTTDTTASGVIENTTSTISGTTDWFPIILVISAMVVLILLTVIIITAIRGSGLIRTGGSARGVTGSA